MRALGQQPIDQRQHSHAGRREIYRADGCGRIYFDRRRLTRLFRVDLHGLPTAYERAFYLRWTVDDPALKRVGVSMKLSILILALALVIWTTVLKAGDDVSAHAPQGATAVSFAKAITLKSPVLYPSSIAAGDLNHDGIPDLAVVGVEEATLEHALGKGNGHFGTWQHDGGAGDAPGFVTFADVDLDGNLDAVTTDADQPFVTVAFGDGKGHFNRGAQLRTGRGYATGQVAVADLDGDGIPDIVGTVLSIGEDFGEIFVLLGKGNREFQKPIHFASGGYQTLAIAVADLNHDNIPDLIVVNNGKQPPYGNVSVLLGKGDGTFLKPVAYHMGQYQDPTSVALGDFNGDGNVDMAVTTFHSNSVHVLLGKGDGTFSHPKFFFVSSEGVGAVVTADFNGDGIPDLAALTGSYPKSGHVAVLLGNGDGTFQAPAGFHVRLNPFSLIVADFNHDGKPDLAAINGDSTISILLNTTPGRAPVRKR